MKNKKIVELMLILGVTAGLAGGCTQKTKEQSYVNITETGQKIVQNSHRNIYMMKTEISIIILKPKDMR